MTQKDKVYKRPNVLSICFAAFFNDMGSDMLFAFYPIFVVSILLVEDMTILGLIESIALLFGLLIRPISGRLADRKGKKKFIWSCYICLAMSRFAQGLAQIWVHLIPLKVLYELGRGVRNPSREALLTDSVPKDERGFAFGLLNSMDTAGAIIGPLLGLGIFSLFLSMNFHVDTCFRLIFICAALPTLFSIFIIVRGTREVYIPTEVPERTQKINNSSIFTNKALLAFTIISCIFSFWAVTENFMLLCGAKVLGISKEEILAIVFLYWFINVSFAPSALMSGRLSDKYGRKLFLQVAFIILAVLTFGFAFFTKFWEIALLFVAHGIYQGFLKPSQTAFVADLSPLRRRAEVLGSYSMLVGMSAIPGPFVFGILWDVYNWKVPFVISGLFVAICAVLFAFIVHEPKE